jgi:dihydrofolate reductase
MTRRIVLTVTVSSDGFFEGPDRDISWHRVDDELHQHFNDHLRGMAAFLEGRVTYELMEEYWPTADQDPDNDPPMREFAGIWRDMPKVVYSRTLREVGPGARIEREVVPEAVRALKEQPGGDLSLGGGDLAASFVRHGLVDELWLYVQPVVLGQGRRPLPDGVGLDLDLLATRAFSGGVVLLRYAVVPAR